jgi:tetratricopeptide (TPR) repeat protein
MWGLILRMMTMPALVIYFAALTHHRITAWAIVNCAAFPLVLLVSVFLHETGHMAAARIVGLPVPRVEVGIGRRLHRWSWRGTTIVLNAFPMSGRTLVGGEHDRGVRWRCWISVAAGPIVTFMLAAAPASWPAPLPLGDVFAPLSALAGGPAIRELVAFANAWMLIFNLVPLPLFRRAGLGWTDGIQLVRLPFVAAAKLREIMTTPALAEAMDCWERDDNVAARRILDEALNRVPNAVGLRCAVGITLMNQERLREARDVFVELYAEQEPKSELRWTLRNNIAWMNFRLRSDDLRAEADEHSAAVSRRYPLVSWALGTRGAVLLWLGRHEDAIGFLERAYVRASLDSHRALNACCLTLALAAQGRKADAREWLDRATRLHAACPLLDEARASIDGESSATGGREAASAAS